MVWSAMDHTHPVVPSKGEPPTWRIIHPARVLNFSGQVKCNPLCYNAFHSIFYEKDRIFVKGKADVLPSMFAKWMVRDRVGC